MNALKISKGNSLMEGLSRENGLRTSLKEIRGRDCKVADRPGAEKEKPVAAMWWIRLKPH